jgi:hypothetical protein
MLSRLEDSLTGEEVVEELDNNDTGAKVKQEEGSTIEAKTHVSL